MKYVELHLTLISGEPLFIRDHTFTVYAEKRRREVSTLGDLDKPKVYYGAGVNGFAVKETMDQVCEMIGKQTQE